MKVSGRKSLASQIAGQEMGDLDHEANHQPSANGSGDFGQTYPDFYLRKLRSNNWKFYNCLFLNSFYCEPRFFLFY